MTSILIQRLISRIVPTVSSLMGNSTSVTQANAHKAALKMDAENKKYNRNNGIVTFSSSIPEVQPEITTAPPAAAAAADDDDDDVKRRMALLGFPVAKASDVPGSRSDQLCALLGNINAAIIMALKLRLPHGGGDISDVAAAEQRRQQLADLQAIMRSFVQDVIMVDGSESEGSGEGDDDEDKRAFTSTLGGGLLHVEQTFEAPRRAPSAQPPPTTGIDTMTIRLHERPGAAAQVRVTVQQRAQDDGEFKLEKDIACAYESLLGGLGGVYVHRRFIAFLHKGKQQLLKHEVEAIDNAAAALLTNDSTAGTAYALVNKEEPMRQFPNLPNLVDEAMHLRAVAGAIDGDNDDPQEVRW